MTMKSTVRDLLQRRPAEEMELTLASGLSGLDSDIRSQRVQKPGLLLTGLLDDGLHPDRIQVFGAAEIGYLMSLGETKLKRSLAVIESAPIPAIIVTRGRSVPDFLVAISERKRMPILTTPLSASILIEKLTNHLEEILAPEATMHGVMVDVLGVGILITGKSGIGKSECALDLISRGYRLVADDAVLLKHKHPGVLFALASDVISHHMEVRGLGIVNIKDIFGITAIRTKKQLDLIVELVDWDPEGAYDRLGFDEMTQEVLGVKLSYLRIPVSPGRSVATVVEVAARNRILKIMGYDPSKKFESHINDIMASKSTVES
jgi:HPr kinase/phosphorylase